MKKSLLFVIAVFAISLISNGQSTDDYRTVTSGDWNTLGTWERYSGAVWQPLTGIAPLTIPTSGDGEITIRSGHIVTVAAAASGDELTIDAGGQVTVNSGITWTIGNGAGVDLTIDGTLQVDGTISANTTNIFIINSGALVNVTGTITGPNNVIVNSGGIMNVTGTLGTGGNGILNVFGNLNISGTAVVTVSSVATLSISGTVSMSGSSTITVSRGNGGPVGTVNSGGLLDISGNASLINASGAANRTFTINSGGTVRLGPAATLSGTGHMVIASGGTIEIGSAAGITTAGATGNVQSTFRTYDVGANYTYNGIANQNMGNGFPNLLTGILMINNPGNTVTLDNVRTITSGGSIVFTNGLLNTTGNLLTLDAGAGVSAASDVSFATGPIKKVGNTAFTFPVGKPGTGYQAIAISGPALATDAFTAEYIRASGTLLGPCTAPGLSHVSNCEYWILGQTTGTSMVDVTLNWNSNSPCNAFSYVDNLSTVVVAHFNGISWDAYGSDGGTSGSVSAGSVTWKNVPVYSPFTLGATNFNPLPVKLSNIKAYEKQQGIQIDWTVYQEDNMSRYAIERSANGNTFTSIGEVASLNSAVETKYGFFDASPLTGLNFYRLRSIGKDGRFAYSSIVKVNLDKSVKDISLYPNPATGGYISFQGADLAKGNYTVKVYNSAGIQVMNQNFIHTGGAINQTLQLPVGIHSGMYSLQLVNDRVKVMSKTFIVQ